MRPRSRSRDREPPKVYDLFGSSDDELVPTPIISPDFTEEDGYLIPQIGSQITKYKVTAFAGRGEFASVVKAVADDST